MNETFWSVNNKRADQNHARGKTGRSWLRYQGSPFSIKSNIHIIKLLTCGGTKNKQPQKGKGENSFTLVSGSKFVDLKKSVQCENCELSFTGGKMRTAAQETAPQSAPRACSKEEEGKVMCVWPWERRNTCNQARLFFRKVLLVTGNSQHWEGF